MPRRRKVVEQKAVTQGVRFSPSDLDALARHLEDFSNELKWHPIVEDGRTNVVIEVSDIDVDGLGTRITAIPDLLKSERKRLQWGFCQR